MSVNLSNIINGGTLSVSGGGTGITSAGTSGNILTSTGSGWLSSPLPTASNVVLGGVKVDGASITINNGVISASSTATKTISNKTAAYTVVASDLGKIINCTSGTFNVSLTAAATLGSGFTCTIWNTSSTSTDAITIDPNSAETIDGVATLILRRGEGLDIVCDGTNWQINNKKPMRGYTENMGQTIGRSTSTGDLSMALGNSATASGQGAYAFGHLSNAGSSASFALGHNSGFNGSVTAFGAGAMALGGSYASGAGSFAAAIADNTSNYGAQGEQSISMGFGNRTSGQRSLCIGGNYGNASGQYSTVINGYAGQAAQTGKFVIASAQNVFYGAQEGKIILMSTSTTATLMTSDQWYAGGTSNQLVIASDQAMLFIGTIIAKQQASNNMAAFNVTGAISNNGGTMVLSSVTLTTITDSIGLTASPTFSIDNTNKALAVVSGYKTSTNVRWVGTFSTTELIYA
jgi:hypothetical protein